LPARTKPGRPARAAAALLACALALGAASCGGRSEPPPAGAAEAAAPDRNPWNLNEGRLALIVTPEGRLEPVARSGHLPYGDAAALPFAVQKAAAALTSGDGRTLVAAINRVGLARFEPGAGRPPDGPRPEPAFQGRSVGGFVAAGDGLALLLYRHPYFEEAGEPGLGGAILHAAGDEADTAALRSFAARNADLFALFPAGDGRYYYQTRRLEGERAYSGYGLFDLASAGTKALDRVNFEAGLAMEAIDKAPSGLRAAAAILPSQLFISARIEGGGLHSYLRGKVDEAAPAMAVIGAYGTLALAEDGSAGYAAPYPAAAAALRLDFATALAAAAGLTAPDPLWRFREPALLEGYAACVWEDGAFPLVARSGLVILALP
jgi:hypothetical protein